MPNEYPTRSRTWALANIALSGAAVGAGLMYLALDLAGHLCR